MPEPIGLITMQIDIEKHWSPSAGANLVVENGEVVRVRADETMPYFQLKQTIDSTWACIHGQDYAVLDAEGRGQFTRWFPCHWVPVEMVRDDGGKTVYGVLKEPQSRVVTTSPQRVIALQDVNLRTEPRVAAETLVGFRNHAVMGEVFTRVGEVRGTIHRGVGLWYELKDAENQTMYAHSLYFKVANLPQTRIRLGAQVAEPWHYNKMWDENWHDDPLIIVNTIKAMRPESFVFITDRGARITKEEVDLLRGIDPDVRLICRSMVKWPDKKKKTIQQLADEMTSGFDPLYREGVRLKSVFCEPQFEHEGFGIQWHSPREFADTWLETVEVLRQRFPDASFGFPAIGDHPDLQTWMEETLYASKQADRVEIHIYPVNYQIQETPLKQVQLICDMVLAEAPDMTFDITEIAMPNQTKHPLVAAELIVDTLEKIAGLGYPIRSANLYTIYINEQADAFANSMLRTGMAEALGRRGQP